MMVEWNEALPLKSRIEWRANHCLEPLKSCIYQPSCRLRQPSRHSTRFDLHRQMGFPFSLQKFLALGSPLFDSTVGSLGFATND
ncbi:hypothetical protein TIFTF001_016530 [Ficus carica]|uniref:Uncharacterized protein n=1 Tax=Ficus carica TaxID=3494 RepID=A0AA88D692_FICCA|nr:hypothetical protein TIFTF001_016530 [Ficus carica]